MLQDMAMTPATAVIVALLAAWAVWAVRRMAGRGLCDCGDACDGCAKKARKGGLLARRRAQGCTESQEEAHAGCSRCSAADGMVARMEASLEDGAKRA